MKKLTIYRKLKMLPLCLLLVFGLMSCEQEEIIPLEAADMVDKTPPSFDISEATGVVIDKNGEITGYYDKELNFFNKEGAPGNASARLDDWRKSLVTLYDGPFFRGQFVTIYIHGASLSQSLSVDLSVIAPGWRNRAESMVISPDVTVTLQDEDAQVFQLTGNLDEAPHYYEELPRNLSNKVDKVFIQRDPSSINDGITEMCGVLYENENYGYWGAKIPFFKDQELDLENLGAPNVYDYTNIKSVASNDDSDCEGVMLYAHATDVNQGYAWFHPDRDDDKLNVDDNNDELTDVGTVRRGLAKVGKINESHVYAYHFKEVDFKIGAVIYQEEDYTGKKLIFQAGKHYKKKKDTAFPVESLVVAPGQSLSIKDESGAVISGGIWAGTLFGANAAHYVHKSTGKSFLQNYTVEVTDDFQNSFCGVAYRENPELSTAGSPELPIFSRDDILFTEDVLSAWNDNIGFFTPNQYKPETSTCQGVTFWDAFGETSLRRWVGPGSEPVDFDEMDKKISAITTEGCDKTSVGWDIDEFNQSIDMFNSISSHEYFIRNGYTNRATATEAIINFPRWRFGRRVLGMLNPYRLRGVIIGAGISVAALANGETQAGLYFAGGTGCLIAYNAVKQYWLKPEWKAMGIVPKANDGALTRTFKAAQGIMAASYGFIFKSPEGMNAAEEVYPNFPEGIELDDPQLAKALKPIIDFPQVQIPADVGFGEQNYYLSYLWENYFDKYLEIKAIWEAQGANAAPGSWQQQCYEWQVDLDIESTSFASYRYIEMGLKYGAGAAALVGARKIDGDWYNQTVGGFQYLTQYKLDEVQFADVLTGNTSQHLRRADDNVN